MAMNYLELDEKMREIMLAEFENEENGGNPYRSAALSVYGQKTFPQLMRDAITKGTEHSLAGKLNNVLFWIPKEKFFKDGKPLERKRNIGHASERLALTEFSTWYVRGLARRLINEGINQCQIYRGSSFRTEPCPCTKYEGKIVDVETIYNNHRKKYWPKPGDESVFSIPSGFSCHHLIKRVSPKEMVR